MITAAWALPLAIGGAFSGVPVVGAGHPAPDFAAVNLSTGDTTALADHRGRVVLLNLWATWCAPCRAEMPSMERAFRELQADGLSILALSMDQVGPEAVIAFAEELGLTFDILHDPSQRTGAVYQVGALPQTFVIGRDGKIVWREFGAADWSAPSYLARLRHALASEPAP